MMTVKELSKMTGISPRTLHYYDEIGLFPPTTKNESGYRLYDETALETLQQILFFREFDIPLKEIKTIMKASAFDRNQILRMQKNMLTAKKERIERLIAGIDGILEEGRKVAFEIFSKSELEEMYDAMAENMTEEQKQLFTEYYGSMENWRKSFLSQAETEEVQKNFEKAAEWYGGKEEAMRAATEPKSADIHLEYQKRMGEITQELAARKGTDVNCMEIQKLAEEYDSLMKLLFQLPDASEMVLEIVGEYQKNGELQKAQDGVYGEGATAYIDLVLETYYKKKK